MNLRSKKAGFTLIELLTVIAILAVILLISIPIILGVLDRARKNSFKNQVLLYVEALKQQTGMALMGSGYSELKSVDNSFYAPTVDSDNKLVRVSVANLNKVMDNVALTNDTDKYFYVEYTDTGYNYYIGEGVRKEGEFSTTCSYASGSEACTEKSGLSLINSRIFNLVHITRNDTEVQTYVLRLNATITSGLGVRFTVSDNESDIAGYCITNTNDSSTCEFDNNTNSTINTKMTKAGTYYIFAKDVDNNISNSARITLTVQNELDELSTKNNGDAVDLAGYKWHVMGQDTNNIYLLMDTFDGNGTEDSNRQIANMAHCTNDTDNSTDCAYNGSYYVYSWEKSLIRDYLNKDEEGGFLYALPTNLKSKLVATEICKDSSINSSNSTTYGGYTKSEIISLSSQGAICTNGYTNDLVRLISPSEYHNFSLYFSGTIYPVTSGYGLDNGYGKVEEIDYITRLSNSNWLYSSELGSFWTTGSYPGGSGNEYLKFARLVGTSGNLIGYDSKSSLGVRPVIVLQK